MAAFSLIPDPRTLIPLFFLTACGFEPLHGQHYRANASIALASLQVEVNRTRRGQSLEAEIKDAVNPDYQKAEKRYRLKIQLNEQEIGLFINPDGTSSRGDFLVSSSYVVTRIADGKELDRGNLQRFSSYNTSETADYASFVSLEDAKKRAVLELAQDYKLRMANLLARLGQGEE